MRGNWGTKERFFFLEARGLKSRENGNVPSPMVLMDE
jgi:hypothetical protein